MDGWMERFGKRNKRKYIYIYIACFKTERIIASSAKLVPATGLDHVLWEIYPLTLLRIPASFEHLAQQLGAMLIYGSRSPCNKSAGDLSSCWVIKGQASKSKPSLSKGAPGQSRLNPGQ
jgi:hypothetical protein